MSLKSKKSTEALLALKQIFDKYNISFWLDCGTLLGAVREGRLIPWDHDVDISTWLKNTPRIVDTQKDFQQLGFEIYVGCGHYKLRDTKTKECLIDIFTNVEFKGDMVKIHIHRFFKHFIWMLSEPDYLSLDYNNFDYDTKFIPYIIRKLLVDICCKIQPEKRRNFIILIWKSIIKFKLYAIWKVYAPMKYIRNFSTIEFYGKKFTIPEDPDGYLTFMYGNWKVPRHKGKLITTWRRKKLPLNSKGEIQIKK